MIGGQPSNGSIVAKIHNVIYNDHYQLFLTQIYLLSKIKALFHSTPLDFVKDWTDMIWNSWLRKMQNTDVK